MPLSCISSTEWHLARSTSHYVLFTQSASVLLLAHKFKYVSNSNIMPNVNRLQHCGLTVTTYLFTYVRLRDVVYKSAFHKSQQLSPLPLNLHMQTRLQCYNSQVSNPSYVNQQWAVCRRVTNWTTLLPHAMCRQIHTRDFSDIPRCIHTTDG